MPLQVDHVTASGGMLAYFGKDETDGWPIGPLAIAASGTFFYDPHADNFQRLWFLANQSKWATGAGTVTPPASGGTPLDGVTPFNPWGEQNRHYRSGSGLPFQEQK